MGNDYSEREGYVTMPHMILKDDRLTADHKWVWLIIFSHFNWQTTQCNPSLKTIMRKSGKSKGKVLEVLDNCRSLRYMDWVSCESGKLDGKSCRYSFPKRIFPKIIVKRGINGRESKN